MAPTSYRGYKYWQQFTRDGHSPEYGITQQYYTFIKSLPPSQQIEYAERAAHDLNRLWGYKEGDIASLEPTDILSLTHFGPNYSTFTHDTYYL